MGEEDWDLSAVVRGCRSSAAAAAATSTNTPPASSSSSSSKGVPLPLIKQENEVCSIPSLIQPTTNGFQELQRLLRPFIPTTTTTTTISTSGCGIYPNSSFTDFAVPGSSSNNINNNINTSASFSYASNTRPHFVPQASPSTSSPGLQRFHDQHVQKLQKQKQIQDQLQQLVHQKKQFITPPGQISSGGSNNSVMTLPNTQAAQVTTRSRKRKSQQRRMVCHVTAENLTADSWAWRKYGQKPIKGSPYPRNYYRCSSLKGCGARKQVERSNTEADMFIVTYTGEHTHPRPTHRNSLAGSTRNKPSSLTTTRQPASHESGSPSTNVNRASSSSQRSPTTPLTEVAAKDECADEPILSNEATSPFPEDDLDLASHDDILIPNMAAMMDKFLLGADELHLGIGLSGGGGDCTRSNPADGSYPSTDPG